MIIDKKADATTRKLVEAAAYRRLAEKLPMRMLQRDARELAGPEPELALIARETLAPKPKLSERKEGKHHDSRISPRSR